MGRTPRPLSILVHPDLAEEPKIKELGEKGHTVVVDGLEGLMLKDYDLVLGSNVWQMDKNLLKYIDVAIKAVRGIKYPRGKK